MEKVFRLFPVLPYDVRFQLSLLRLMYPGSPDSPQVEALQQMQEPAGAVPPR